MNNTNKSNFNPPTSVSHSCELVGKQLESVLRHVLDLRKRVRDLEIAYMDGFIDDGDVNQVAPHGAIDLTGDSDGSDDSYEDVSRKYLKK
jgi:hypothetical protein